MIVRKSIGELAESVWRWRHAASFGVLDQAASSIGNFVFTILLLRWMGLEAFGYFSIVVAFLLLIQSLVVAVLVETMPYVAARFRHMHPASYETAAFRLGVMMALTLGFLTSLLGLSLVAAGSLYGLSAVIAGGALAGILIHFIARRLCYVGERVDRAAIASLCYTTALLVQISIFEAMGWLSPTSAFAALGLSAALAATICRGALRLHNRHLSLVRLSKVFLRHWQHGRWLVASAVVFWLTSSALIPFLGVMLDARAAGAFRGLQQLLSPLAQGLGALQWVILPRATGGYRQQGPRFLRRISTKVTVVFGSCSLLYALALLAGGAWVLERVFSWTDVGVYETALVFVAMAALFDGLKQGFAFGLQAGGFFRDIFAVRLVGVLVMALVIWPLVTGFAVSGAVGALALVNLAVALAAGGIAWRRTA